MLKSIKILRRQSELKSTIREFDGRDDLTDAEKAKLTAAQVELAQSETDLREAFDAEEAEREANARQNPGISAEVREYVNLARAASVTQFMAIGADTLALSDASGETRELLSARERQPLHGTIPWPALLSAADLDAIASGWDGEVDANGELVVSEFAATEAPTDVNRMTDPIIRAVFARSNTTYLGVVMRSAGIGEQAYPVIGQQPAANRPAFVAGAGAVQYPAIPLTTATLKPHRIGRGFEVKEEDLAVLSGMEDALRGHVLASLTEAVDFHCINGGNNPNIAGFLHELTDPAAPTAEVTFQSGSSTVTGIGDGVFAPMRRDIRVLVGKETNEKFGGLFPGNSAEDLVEAIERKIGGYRYTPHIPAIVAKVQQAIGIRTGAPGMNAVMPMWRSGPRVVRDEKTEAAEGMIKVTASLLTALKVLREAAYIQIAFKLQA